MNGTFLTDTHSWLPECSSVVTVFPAVLLHLCCTHSFQHVRVGSSSRAQKHTHTCVNQSCGFSALRSSMYEHERNRCANERKNKEQQQQNAKHNTRTEEHKQPARHLLRSGTNGMDRIDTQKQEEKEKA